MPNTDANIADRVLKLTEAKKSRKAIAEELNITVYAVYKAQKDAGQVQSRAAKK